MTENKICEELGIAYGKPPGAPAEMNMIWLKKFASCKEPA